MLVKKLQFLAGLSLVASASFLVAAPSQAQSTESVGTAAKVNLMTGHPMLQELKDLDPEAVAVGRVAGRAGSIISIKFLEPVTVGDRQFERLALNQPNWHVNQGDDVILAYKDGQWLFVGDGACTMSWLSRLNLKDAPQTQAIEWNESRPVALPPVTEPRVSAPVPEPEPEPSPVRGLW